MAPPWLFTDNAGEYNSNLVTAMLGDMDIGHVPTIAYKPEENDVSGRLKLMLMNAIRAVLKRVKLD